jgi:hypothetical protein
MFKPAGVETLGARAFDLTALLASSNTTARSRECARPADRNGPKLEPRHARHGGR